MWCDVGVAEKIELKCEIKDRNLKALKKNARKTFIGETIILVVDKEKGVVRNNNPGNADIIHGVLEELTLKEGDILFDKDVFHYKSEIPIEGSNTIYKYEGKIFLNMKDKKTLMVKIDDGSSTISKLFTEEFEFIFICQ